MHYLANDQNEFGVMAKMNMKYKTNGNEQFLSRNMQRKSVPSFN